MELGLQNAGGIGQQTCGEWVHRHGLGKEVGYKLYQLASPNKMKPCGK